MLKYRIADAINGAFGDVYTSLTAAENALKEEIMMGQVINDTYAQEYADAGTPIPSAADFFLYRRNIRLVKSPAI